VIELVAAQPLRTIDVVGLIVVMVVGLMGVAGYRQFGAVLAAMIGAGVSGRRPRNQERAVESVARALALAFAAFAVIGASLAALGVLVPRPGPYPGGVATKVAAIGALVVLGVLAFRELAARQRAG
jgi:hypothetical protein